MAIFSKLVFWSLIMFVLLFICVEIMIAFVLLKWWIQEASL